MSDEEDARLTAAAEADPDNPPLRSDAILQKAEDVLRKRRGRPRSEVAKAMLTLRIDQNVLDTLRRDGPGWQTRLNKVIEAYAKKRVATKPSRRKAAS